MALQAIVGATVLDGNGGEPLENSVILIDGARISAVGDASLPIPPQAQITDAAGRYIIPGLMDANVHLMLDLWPPSNLVRYENRYHELAIEAAQIALRNGVTTVFDSWGPRESLQRARDLIGAGQAQGARIYLAGNIVGLGGPYSDDFFPQAKDGLLAETAARLNEMWQQNVGPELLWMAPEQVRQEIRKYLGTGIDFLKYAVTGHSAGSMQFIEFSPRVQRVIVEETHRAGLTVQTHTTSGEGLHLAIEAGVDLLQHADVTGPRAIPAETLELLASQRVACAVLANTDRALRWYRERMTAVPFFNSLVVADRNQRALLDAGATILLSTDAGVFRPELVRSAWWRERWPDEDCLLTLGEGHFHWLLAMEQKGMRAMDALQAATRNIARAYRVDRDVGTLEAGKLADLLILDRDPLAAAVNYRSIHLVMKEGRVVDRDSLPAPALLSAQSEAAGKPSTAGDFSKTPPSVSWPPCCRH